MKNTLSLSQSGTPPYFIIHRDKCPFLGRFTKVIFVNFIQFHLSKEYEMTMHGELKRGNFVNAWHCFMVHRNVHFDVRHQPNLCLVHKGGIKEDTSDIRPSIPHTPYHLK